MSTRPAADRLEAGVRAPDWRAIGLCLGDWLRVERGDKLRLALAPMSVYVSEYVPGPGACEALAIDAASGRVLLPKPKRGVVLMLEVYCTAFVERIAYIGPGDACIDRSLV